MTDTTDPTILASLLSDRDDTIASLRALLKAKEHEIADLTRDRDRFEGRILFANAGSALRAPSTLGAPICGGVTLTTADLSDFAHESDASLADDHERNLARCIRARRDGFVLCLRPTANRPAVVDMGQHAAADALLGAEAQRFLVVDPYSADVDDMRDAPVAAGVGVTA